MRLTRNDAVLAGCLAVVVGMVGASYAAVPLYYMFCRATGYGGTPNRADAAPGATGDRVITVASIPMWIRRFPGLSRRRPVRSK